MADRHAVTLRWDDRAVTVPAKEDETVLDAVEAAGETMPAGCRTGACSTCVGRLLEGTVDYDRPPRALRPRHVAAGYVLCCIASPQTDCRIRVGADVQRELVSNPWK